MASAIFWRVATPALRGHSPVWSGLQLRHRPTGRLRSVLAVSLPDRPSEFVVVCHSQCIVPQMVPVGPQEVTKTVGNGPKCLP